MISRLPRFVLNPYTFHPRLFFPRLYSFPEWEVGTESYVGCWRPDVVGGMNKHWLDQICMSRANRPLHVVTCLTGTFLWFWSGLFPVATEPMIGSVLFSYQIRYYRTFFYLSRLGNRRNGEGLEVQTLDLLRQNSGFRGLHVFHTPWIYELNPRPRCR